MRLLPRNRFLRVLAILGIVVGTLELLYIVVANIALAAIAKRFANSDPVGVAFERGYTWFPLRFHLHGVHVKGKGWTAVMSDADVVTTLTRIDSLTADVTSVEIEDTEPRRSKGKLHVVITDIAIDNPRVSFNADAKVQDATLEHGATVLASGVHGSIVLKVAPVDLSSHSLFDTASGTVTLDGEFLSLEPLASFASLTTTQDRGTLHVAGTLTSGVLQPASEIRAHTTHATLKDAKGANADFPRGIDAIVRVAATAKAELELAVQTPSLAFGSADPSKPPDVFDDYELTVPAGYSDLKLNHFEMRSLSWSTRHALIHEGATTLSAAAKGTLYFDVSRGDELVAKSGVITATSVTVENPDVPERAPFDAHLDIQNLTISRKDGLTLRGPLHASGDDVRPIALVIISSESIRRTLGPLPKQAFTLDAKLNRTNRRVTLDDLMLKSSRLQLRGGYRRDDKTTSGAFLLENGPIPVGITMHDKNESLVYGASRGWLEQQLRE